jgi:hypothetical protein
VLRGHNDTRFHDAGFDQLTEEVETIHESETGIADIERDTILWKGEVAMNDAACRWLKEVAGNGTAEERANIFISES